MERLHPIQILLVEDSIGDIRLTEEALKESKLRVDLSVVMDGVEAMAFLRKEDKYTNVSTPDLILLDLNLPRKDGRQVLKEIKEDANLRSIPVAILSISKAEEDIAQSYNTHVNCYITKPLDLEQFIEVVRSIEHFWFTIVTLPPKTE
ncbi:two-component response regulator [Legionella beliardensis]|uniref:Two-component response regulator n=1 Tax=Legionella beliardensis TaxID=91822 RepID=A0A378I3C9_9GAMM|nr:response regulator [Legionella beliardensis]STX29668.1 two-component response regulator [Legionella beliardensis]